MGCAIAEGLLCNETNKVSIKNPADQLCKIDASKYGPQLDIIHDFSTIVAADIDFIIIAVKPNLVKIVLDEAREILSQSKAYIVSVAAGLAFDKLRDWVPADLNVIRAMPNLPVSFGAGLFGYYADQHCPDFESVFSICGDVIYLKDEDMMHGFTALAGSGPAYIFHMMEALSLSAQKLGFPQDDADIIARKTVIGASLLAHNRPDISASELRMNVTSPGGTTQAGLEALMSSPDLNIHESALTKLATATLQAAQKRSREMS